MRRLSIQVIAALAYTIAAPALSYAQASIAGTVSDPSGAALPGVAVEVTGPSLIEKTRSVVSDSTGRYRIVELPPGDYSLSFALSGFRSVKRDAIELTGSFTATVDVTLPVGSVTETVTVTVPSPVVDVQSAQRQTVLDGDIVKSIPAARTFYGLAQLTPGITLVGTTPGAGGGSLAPIVVQMAAYGGPVTEGVVQVNGNQVRIGLGGGSSYHQLAAPKTGGRSSGFVRVLDGDRRGQVPVGSWRRLEAGRDSATALGCECLRGAKSNQQ